MFNLNEKIGVIAAKFPKVIDIFKKYGIDFCCGGNRKLIEAVKEKNLQGDKLILEINNAYEEYRKGAIEDKDWSKEPYINSIEHIVNTHHAYLNENLPNVSELLNKILRVHGEKHKELIKVHKLFNALRVDLEQHLIKEEVEVFPIIIQYEKNKDKELLKLAVEKIKELEEEHEGAGTILKELRKITNNYSLPIDACNSYKLTYQLIEAIEDDTFRHIHLENNILFPRVLKECNS